MRIVTDDYTFILFWFNNLREEPDDLETTLK